MSFVRTTVSILIHGTRKRRVVICRRVIVAISFVRLIGFRRYIKMLDVLEKAELEEVSKLIARTVIPEIVRIADTYNYDRDSLIEYIAAMFYTMAKVSTFEEWGRDKKSGNYRKRG